MKNLEYYIEIIEVHQNEIDERIEMITRKKRQIIDNFCPLKKGDLVVVLKHGEVVERGEIINIQFKNRLFYAPTKDDFSNYERKWHFKYFIFPYVKDFSRKNKHKNPIWYNSVEYKIEKHEE